jgi:hypothetical protein
MISAVAQSAMADHGQADGRRAEQDGVRQADAEEADGIKNAVADGHEHLAAEKGDEITVDRAQDKHELVFEARVRHRQIVGPVGLDAALLQQQVEGVDWNQGQSRQKPEPRGHPADLSEQPPPGLRQRLGQPAGGGVQRLLIERPAEQRGTVRARRKIIRRAGGEEQRGRGIGRLRIRRFHRGCFAPQQFLEQRRRVIDPNLDSLLHIHGIGRHARDELAGFPNHLWSDAAEHGGQQQQGNSEDAEDGARSRKPLALEPIHHRIEQVSDDRRDGKRPQHRRKDLEHLAESPNQRRNQRHQRRDRQAREREPDQARLGWSGRRHRNFRFEI